MGLSRVFYKKIQQKICPLKEQILVLLLFIFLWDRKNCLECAKRAAGLPEGVHWYVEWRSLFVVKRHKTRKKSNKMRFFNKIRLFYNLQIIYISYYYCLFTIWTFFTSPTFFCIYHLSYFGIKIPLHSLTHKHKSAGAVQIVFRNRSVYVVLISSFLYAGSDAHVIKNHKSVFVPLCKATSRNSCKRT